MLRKKKSDGTMINGLDKKGNLGDMFMILTIIGFAVVLMIVFILFINKINTAINADATIGSAGKSFISNIQSQNGWSLDFIFVMLLISLPLVSAVLAYFNNIPPIFFWGSIGVLMMVIICANVLGDAFSNLINTGDAAGVASSVPMTNYIMTHFVIYAFFCCIVIMIGVFMKPKGVSGY